MYKYVPMHEYLLYSLQGQLPLSGMNVIKCDDEENYPYGMEISGKCIKNPCLVFLWVSCLKFQITTSLHLGLNLIQAILV